MKKEIANNDHYYLAVDLEKQRLYVELKGEWIATEVAMGYLEDIRESIRHFIDSYSCLADFTRLLPFTDQGKIAVHSKALNLLINSGLKDSAQVMPDDYTASEQLLQIISDQGKRIAAFGDAQLAEMYLDAKQMVS